ncbi:MAG TPA: hypothetical protein VFF19_31690 [Reyranella sp.]|nr:hypothetical protein [Reyranella sp.]
MIISLTAGWSSFSPSATMTVNTKSSSAADAKLKGWPTGSVNRDGTCVIVISTSIRPRAASSSQSRFTACSGPDG